MSCWKCPECGYIGKMKNISQSFDDNKIELKGGKPIREMETIVNKEEFDSFKNDISSKIQAQTELLSKLISEMETKKLYEPGKGYVQVTPLKVFYRSHCAFFIIKEGDCFLVIGESTGFQVPRLCGTSLEDAYQKALRWIPGWEEMRIIVISGRAKVARLEIEALS